MSLADHYGGGYFPEGAHRVTVTGTRFFSYNSGSPGVEFALSDGRRSGKLSFCLHEKALWKLANFAADLGVSQADMKRIDPERKRGFDLFLGKPFIAVVTKQRHNDEKEYCDVTDWQPVPTGFDARPAPQPPHIAPVDDDPTQVDEDEAPATSGEVPNAADIPF